MPRRIKSLDERFFAHVEFIPFHDCWEWSGALDHNGHGQMQYDHITRKKTGPHRVSYELHYGEIPETDDDGNPIVVRHKCDNRSCVRPEHLELGTQSDNMQDCSKRGRLNTWSSRVTHCPQDHPYDEHNTGIRRKADGRTSRRCRACDREAARLYRQRVKG